MKKVVLLGVMVLTMLSCTENKRAKSWGGTADVELKPNEELVNVTWKGDELWLLVKDKNTDNYVFREKSSFGIMEGTYILKPHKGK